MGKLLDDTLFSCGWFVNGGDDVHRVHALAKHSQIERHLESSSNIRSTEAKFLISDWGM